LVAVPQKPHMKLNVALLLVWAVVPVTVMLASPGAQFSILSGGGGTFCFLWGLAWCLFFAYAWHRADPAKEKHLLWMLPLVLFAFGIPAYYAILCVVVMIQTARGVAPP